MLSDIPNYHRTRINWLTYKGMTNVCLDYAFVFSLCIPSYPFVSLSTLRSLCCCFPKDKDGGSKKSSKRTSSFNIRRRTRSFKDKYKLPEMLPPPDLKAFVERKQELQGGGKKAAIRSWKSFYAVLFGQILAFFKDDEGLCVLFHMSVCMCMFFLSVFISSM